MRVRALLLLLGVLLACVGGGARAQSLALSLGDLEGPNWSAHDVRVALNIGAASRVRIARLEAMGNKYTDLNLTCKQLLLDQGDLRCVGGLLETPEKLPVDFTYSPARRSLTLSAVAQAGERWDIKLAGEESTLRLQGASLARLAPWLPGDLKPNAGRVTGTARFTALEAHIDVRLEDAGFSDTPGLHAGEKLAGALKIDARRAQPAAAWQWRMAASWDKGAVFWSPVYLSNAGHTVEGEGEYLGDRVTARRISAAWPHLGRIDGDFALDLKAKNFERVNLKGQGLKLTALRDLIPQDWLEKHDLADLTLAGSADLELRQTGDDIERFKLRVADAGLNAADRRLSMRGLSLLVDYDHKQPGP